VIAIHAITLGARGLEAALLRRLRGHAAAVTHVSWSPDDSLILSCSADKTARLWDAATGACVAVLARHAECVTAGAWGAGGACCYTAGLDKRLICWEVPPAGGTPGAPPAQGIERASWRLPRVSDLAMSADGALLAAVCAERRVRLWRPDDDSESWVTAPGAVTACALSADATTLALALQSQEVHLWDCGGAVPSPARALRGQPERTGRFVVRPAFGGHGDAFVACGCEDSQVYVWRAATGELLSVLPGHAGVVNAVAWSAAQPALLASASDDRTVRVWASEALLASLGGETAT
jgi:WD40 repeat protein